MTEQRIGDYIKRLVNIGNDKHKHFAWQVFDLEGNLVTKTQLYVLHFHGNLKASIYNALVKDLK